MLYALPVQIRFVVNSNIKESVFSFVTFFHTHKKIN